VKKLKLAIIVTFLVVMFTSVSLAAADTVSISATGQAFWTAANPGMTSTVTINFQSASSSELYLYRIGIHTDWQDSGNYYTKDLSSSPETIEANGLYSTTVSIQIPATVPVGQHSLIISADGYDSDGNQFNWDSASVTFNVGVTSSANPTSNSNGNSDNPSNGGLNNLLIYIAVIVVVAVVAILLAIVLVKKKSKPKAVLEQYTPAPKPITRPPPAEAPEQEPEDKSPDPKPEGKDFDI
jgi:hypothetical protein